MKKIATWIKDNIEKHPIYVFLLFITQVHEIWLILKNTINIIINKENMDKALELLELYKNFNWFNAITQFIIVCSLYMILKKYIALKKGVDTIVQDINKGFHNTNTHINEVTRILNLKINYTNFYLENHNLPIEDYVKKLNQMGYSIEDLKDIGLDENFIKENKGKIFPRAIMQKYNDFRYELENHKKNI
jgi:hypothetical protein